MDEMDYTDWRKIGGIIAANYSNSSKKNAPMTHVLSCHKTRKKSFIINCQLTKYMPEEVLCVGPNVTKSRVISSVLYSRLT